MCGALLQLRSFRHTVLGLCWYKLRVHDQMSKWPNLACTQEVSAYCCSRSANISNLSEA